MFSVLLKKKKKLLQRISISPMKRGTKGKFKIDIQTDTHIHKIFWRTTVKKQHLFMSKHNTQSKFPQGQFISQLHPQCDLVEILLTVRF